MDTVTLESLKRLIVVNPRNQSLLQLLGITSHTNCQLRTWQQADSGFDEGGQLFFESYGKNLPENTKYTLQIRNIMVNPDNGIIFASHYGRCTFFIRCDFDRCGLKNSDLLRRGETLDGTIDIQCLGNEWALLSYFVEEELENLEWAYLLTQVY